MSDKAKWPLRRIVSERVDAIGVTRQTLECGHIVRQREDIIGPVNAYRRRCRECAALSATMGDGQES